MKPLMSRTEDSITLQDLGRASVQIVHDLKNQLNGLKLYATFLRKRLENSDRPADERETINKLISGLDRAANDLSTIVQYGRTIELKKQSGVDLEKIIQGVCLNLAEPGCSVAFESESRSLTGEFDQPTLTEAFKSISAVAIRMRPRRDESGAITISIRRRTETNVDDAVIEWSGLKPLDHDPFHSFAGSDEIKMSLAAKIVAAHGGTTEHKENSLVVTLPLSTQKA